MEQLYYLRDRTGKSARIAEKIRKKIGIDIDVKPEIVSEENLAPVTNDIKNEANTDKVTGTGTNKEEAAKAEAKPATETKKEEAPKAETKTETTTEPKAESSEEKK